LLGLLLIAFSKLLAPDEPGGATFLNQLTTVIHILDPHSSIAEAQRSYLLGLVKGMTPEGAIAPMWWPRLRPAIDGVDQLLSLMFTENGRDKITHWIIFAGETPRL
jgi:hypothetical protein